MPPERGQRAAQLRMVVGSGRIDSQSGPQLGHRSREIAARSKKNPEILMRRGQIVNVGVGARNYLAEFAFGLR